MCVAGILTFQRLRGQSLRSSGSPVLHPVMVCDHMMSRIKSGSITGSACLLTSVQSLQLLTYLVIILFVLLLSFKIFWMSLVNIFIFSKNIVQIISLFNIKQIFVFDKLQPTIYISYMMSLSYLRVLKARAYLFSSFLSLFYNLYFINFI